MLQFNSALLALAGLFVGQYAPYQAIHVRPHADGVLVASTNQGHVSFLGYDSQGTADERCNLIASDKLLAACTGIKSAERDIVIDGPSARVTTYRKTADNEIKEFPILYSSLEFPPLEGAIAACIDRWSATPAISATAGRYAASFLTKALKAAAGCSDSIALSAFDGGPLRIQCQGLDMLILVMPQAAEPVPPLPDWVCSFAQP